MVNASSGLRTAHEVDQVLDGERCADGGDQEDQPGSVSLPQRFVGHAFQDEGGQCGGDHGDDQRQDQVQDDGPDVQPRGRRAEAQCR